MTKQEQILEGLYKALQTAADDNEVDVAYAAYVFFCGLGSLVHQNESSAAFEKYVNDIRQNNQRAVEAQRNLN